MLYKAKRKNWRELSEKEWWVEGYYVHFKQNDNHCIYYEKDGFTLACDIDVSTLCACTGRKDVKKNLIWENILYLIWTHTAQIMDVQKHLVLVKLYGMKKQCRFKLLKDYQRKAMR